MVDIRRRNPIGVFTVVYPGAERFLDAYFRSLSVQTRKDFDVFLVNDGMEGLDGFVQKYNDLSILTMELHGSPVKVRERGLNAIAQSGYEDIVFGDADDYFDDRRAERVTGYLRSHPVVFNELNIVDSLSNPIESKYLSRRLTPSSCIGADDLADKNVLGFSNTAVKGRLLNGRANFAEDLIALDWYFFTSLLARGVQALFTDDTSTYYRRHDSNVASFTDMGEGNILNGVKVKVAHYRAMALQGGRYTRLWDEYETLEKRLESDSSFERLYVRKVCDNMPENALWWEMIRTPGEIGL